MVAGADIASGPVWMEYVAYLKSVPVRILVSFSARDSIWLLSLVIINHCHIFFCNDQLKTKQAQSTLEESQRMTTIRKTYQRAIVMPTHHVEQLWRDYENFENSVSRALVELDFGFLFGLYNFVLWSCSLSFKKVCDWKYNMLSSRLHLVIRVLLYVIILAIMFRHMSWLLKYLVGKRVVDGVPTKI